MDPFSQTNPAEDHGMRKWFLWALAISLLVHAVLLVVFRMNKLERFDAGTHTERLVPRAFSIKPTKIDPKLFEPEKQSADAETQTRRPDPSKLPTIEPDKPSMGKLKEKVKLTPNTAELVKPLLNEKPARLDAQLPKVEDPQQIAAPSRDLDALQQEIVNERAPKIAASAETKFPPASAASRGQGKAENGTEATGFSNLDDLLAQSGPLTGDVAPVSMPGGALFEYDSADLLPKALEMLSKLGEVIRRNPRATFSIEGHSDSFGDPAYNQKLSEARAESVKTWLVDKMKLDPSKIHTRGFGSTHLIVPASGSREEQQMNRRVEIVIKTPKD